MAGGSYQHEPIAEGVCATTQWRAGATDVAGWSGGHANVIGGRAAGRGGVDDSKRGEVAAGGPRVGPEGVVSRLICSSFAGTRARGSESERKHFAWRWLAGTRARGSDAGIRQTAFAMARIDGGTIAFRSRRRVGCDQWQFTGRLRIGGLSGRGMARFGPAESQ